MKKKITLEKIFIVVPVYNESKVLKKVITELKKSGYKNCIIVDDGSNDESYKVATTEKVYALRHVVNRGKGSAIMTGLEAASMLHADAIVTIDGDGQHDPKNIKALIAVLEKGYDVALGSRAMNIHNAPLIRIIANFVGNFFTFLFYGIWVSDSQGGMRAYNEHAYKNIHIKNDRYEYDSEIIREIARHKLTFKEIPITVRYTKYSTSKKHKQTIMNGIKMIFRMFLSS